MSSRRKAHDKIPRAFETLNRHIWYDQMKKNKERRVYTVVEHKVMIDPFFSRPAEYTALTRDDLHQDTKDDTLSHSQSHSHDAHPNEVPPATASGPSVTASGPSDPTETKPKRSRKSKSTLVAETVESGFRLSKSQTPAFPKTRVMVELFC